MSEIEVSVTVGGVEYSAQIVAGIERGDGATKVSIYRNSAVRGAVWVGAGWWVGRIDGCDAVLGEDVYAALDAAICDALIAEQAKESAAELRRQGWDPSGDAYDIGVCYGDAEALAERLGRKASKAERSALETAIRAELGAVS